MRKLIILLLLSPLASAAQKDYVSLLDKYMQEQADVNEFSGCVLVAKKGKILYAKYCGTQGHGICSESFAEYHIWRGEYVVAEDFLVYLEAQLSVLDEKAYSDPRAALQLTITQGLVDRIKSLLGEAQP